MLRALAKSYVLHMRPGSVEVVALDTGRAVVRLADIYNFLDSHNVGVFEGLFRHAKVTGRVRIASYSPSRQIFSASGSEVRPQPTWASGILWP